MAEKKQSALALLDILITSTDEEHILSGKQLLDLLEKQYGLKLERRTLYSNLNILEQNGYHISRFEDNGKGYYLEGRQFEKAEVLLLCNAIHASHFISAKQSDQLIRKLLKTLSRYQAAEFLDQVYLPNPQKTPNKELLYHLGLVSEAIRDHKTLHFRYLRYDAHKKLVPRREEEYIVEPRYIVYADTRAYMIVTSPHYEGFGHYRLDRMSRAVLGEEKVPVLPKELDAYEYARNKLFMYTGEPETVLFRCQERIMDPMIDLFGTGVSVFPGQDGTFALQIVTSRTGAKFLAQQYLDALEILEPEDLREEFRQQLQEAEERYRKD